MVMSAGRFSGGEILGVWARWFGAMLVLLFVAVTSAQAQGGGHRAPGFSELPKGSKILIAPLDVELFSVSAGGVLEPKADWTERAQRNFKAALEKQSARWELSTQRMAADDADAHAEALALQAAVAQALSVHHVGFLKLPTKAGQLSWSLGEAMTPIREATGARYGLFVWVRDSYASPERVAMMIGLALLGVGVGGGMQVGYATLVDLESGQVLWFNQLIRGHGDLREPEPAAESVGALLAGFPSPK